MSLRQQMRRNYDDTQNILNTQWTQADYDQRQCIGDQQVWQLLYPGTQQPPNRNMSFNITNGAVQMVSGWQRKNRKSTICIPIQNQMQKTADQLTKCLYHVHDSAGAYQVYSTAFEQGALTQGLGFISIYRDLTKGDPISGDICLRYIDMKSCIFDPFFRKPSMIDARFFWTRQFFDRQEAALLYSDFHDKIMSLPPGNYRDEKFYYMPEVYQIQYPNLIAMDEYWYASTRSATYLVDKKTEEVQEWEKDDEELDKSLTLFYRKNKEFKDRFAVLKKPKPTVRRALMVNDKVFSDEPDPNRIDRYPVVPILGYFNPDTPYYAYKFRGIVRDSRSAQHLFNRRKIVDLDICESQQQGLKIKKGALVTPQDGLNAGNGRILTIDDEYQMTDVEPMQIIPPSPVLLQMEDMLKSTAMEILGASEVMMGFEVDDKSGLMTALRQGAGLVRLQSLFDQLDEAQKQCGGIIIEMIQKLWTEGKVRQVIGEDPTPEFQDKLFFKYGAKVVQGMLTETQQQLELNQLLYFKQVTGIDIPNEEILEIAQIQNKDRIVKKIAEREKAAAEQAQQMSQLQMQQLQIDNQTKLSYANSQDGLADERRAKIQLDRAVNEERLSRAGEERAAGAVNLLKALKELEGMDLTHMTQKIEALMQLKSMISEPAEVAQKTEIQ